MVKAGKRWAIISAVFLGITALMIQAMSAHADKGAEHIHYKVPKEYQGKKNPYWADLSAILDGGLIYQEKCAVCHGEREKGDGPLARFLDPKPVNFIDSKMMSEMNDGYLLWRVKDGGKFPPFNSVMPRWGGVLTEDEIWKVIAYIHAFSHGIGSLKLEHVHPPESLAEDVTSESKGHINYKVPDEYKGRENPYWADLPAILDGGLIYQEKCAVCHGRRGNGDSPLARLLNPKPTNFDDSRKMADVEADYLFWRVSEGGKFWPFESVMPRWKGVLTDDEIWKVISYEHAFSHGKKDLKLNHIHPPHTVP